MRLGLLGPAPDQKEVLADAARTMQESLGVDRVLYLGYDRVLDLVASEWAEVLVGPGADDLTIMRRDTAQCLHAEPAAIDSFLQAEHERSRLRMFQSLA